MTITYDKMLLQVTGAHFCAGLCFENGKVARYAPILKYMNNWTEFEVRRYCDKKQWECKTVETAK